MVQNLVIMAKPRYIRTTIPLSTQKITVYASPRFAELFREVSYNMDIFKGVKLSQLLEYVYEQGKKDGARVVFAQLDVLKGKIPHRNPGQPKRR